MKLSTFGNRIADFARTALTAATRKSNRQSAIGNRQSPAPLALASIIRPQVRERWLLPQVGAITPQYIEMTLRGALAGAHLPQWELLNLMEDTWPRLRKNVLELKMAVRNRRAVFEAYRDEDEQESPAATERMKLVSAALRKMQPDPAADECAFDDMVSDILDAWFKGVSVLEIDWHLAQTRQLGRFVAPRCTRWASPANYAWSTDLRLGLADEMQQTLTPFPTDRVIVAKCKTKSGSILGGALLRPLVWWWCAANFSADWLLNLAQVFGLPFRWATYEPTAAQETVDRICAMLQNMGSAGWAAFPAGTALELKAEGTKSGAQTPQGDMLDRADKQCDLLVLGQTLTTDTGGMGRGGGSQALGQVHADVRADIIDAAAKFTASVIEQQLIPAILRLNYGDADEAPTLTFHERGDDDLGARAQWIATLTNAGAGRIIPLDWLAKTFGIPKPDAGEITLGQAKQEEERQGNGNLASRESRDAAVEDDALQAGFWKEDLHPRARGGLFTSKPATATSNGFSTVGSATNKLFAPPEPKPALPGKSSSHPEPDELKPSQAKPAVTAAEPMKSAEQILTDLQPHIKDLSKLRQLENKLFATRLDLNSLKPYTMEDYHQQKARLTATYLRTSKRAEDLENDIITQSRKIVALPLAHRGSVAIEGKVPKKIQTVAQDGMRIVETYVHASILPKTQFKTLPAKSRCAFHLGRAHISLDAIPLEAVHEIVHGLEWRHNAVLQKSRDFLAKRTKGEKPIPLCKINPSGGYKPDEVTFEDKWVVRGGHVYSGKYYGPPGTHDPQLARSTELLTVGIERLHANPALFASTDPEYFAFVVNTIRNL